MPVSTGKEFVVPLANETGALAELAMALARDDINVLGFACEGGPEFGAIRLVTDNARATERMLREARHAFRVNDVVTVSAPNTPGQLALVAQRLAASGVNVHAAYTTAAEDGAAVLTFSVDDLRSAQKILS